MQETNAKKSANNFKAYFSKPANVITIVFLVLLILTVVIPLFTLLIGSFRINGNQEAIYVGNELVDGDYTFHHWTELLTSKEFNYRIPQVQEMLRRLFVLPALQENLAAVIL